MTPREITAPHSPEPGALDESVPGQSKRRAAVSPADRFVRQVQAIDAWIAARREREQALHAPSMTRDERMDVAREVEALRRTHDAIKGRCARGLGAGTEPLRWPAPTAVVAHRHVWFVDQLTLLLAGHGVTVLLSTDNAAEALGAVVSEQPDIVLLGNLLAMVPVDVLLAEARRFAPDALLAVAVSDPRRAGDWRAQADAVFLRDHAPREVADALSVLCHSTV